MRIARDTRLEEHLLSFNPDQQHAAEYHFWRRVAEKETPRPQRGGAASIAERYAAKARARWASANAQMAASAASLQTQASPTMQLAAATELRARAMALAAEAAARVAYARVCSHGIAIRKLTDERFDSLTRFSELTGLDKPWVVAAFEAVGLEVPQEADYVAGHNEDDLSVCTYVPPVPLIETA